jgi:dihydroneopterin aldolase / 2-amino-4-hydroxy-6-hydroxymethyldihydropteridine diphosphokinase / dihydropteroate synthase
LEALTSFAASKTLSILQPHEPASVTIRVAKPSALIFASSAEVQITRTFDDYPDLFNRATSTSHEPASPAITSNVAIALGSNLGDSFHNIEYALRLLEYLPQEETLDGKDLAPLPFVRIIDTSFLYKTAPMYVTDQPAFINAACMVCFLLLSDKLLSLI